MSAWGAVAGGFVGAVVLTTALRAASELGLTRMDLPFLLGTAFSADRTRAKALGYVLHFVVGQCFAFVYYGIFLAIGHDGWALGPPDLVIEPSEDAHGKLGELRCRPAAAGAARLHDAQLRSPHTGGDTRLTHSLRRHCRRLHRSGQLATPSA